MAKKGKAAKPAKAKAAPEPEPIDYSKLGDGPHRVHFHNGQSGEYTGSALKHGSRPFHDHQVKSIEPIVTPGSEDSGDAS
jgi:hypothetical protein